MSDETPGKGLIDMCIVITLKVPEWPVPCCQHQCIKDQECQIRVLVHGDRGASATQAELPIVVEFGSSSSKHETSALRGRKINQTQISDFKNHSAYSYKTIRRL
jgi:hypothetical protein